MGDQDVGGEEQVGGGAGLADRDPQRLEGQLQVCLAFSEVDHLTSRGPCLACWSVFVFRLPSDL